MTTKLTIRSLKREIKNTKYHKKINMPCIERCVEYRNKLKMMLLELKTRRYKMLEKVGYYISEPKAGWEVRENNRGERYRVRVS